VLSALAQLLNAKQQIAAVKNICFFIIVILCVINFHAAKLLLFCDICIINRIILLFFCCIQKKSALSLQPSAAEHNFFAALIG